MSIIGGWVGLSSQSSQMDNKVPISFIFSIGLIFEVFI